ncbi:MAG: PAS domain S-box protein [Oscillochloris sp.]|nr:PAS domain S-box protein [Oscillochloris sp.]
MISESIPDNTGDEKQPTSAAPSYPLPLDQEALDAMPFPFAIYTCDGLLVGANILMEHLFHAPRSAVIGRFNVLTDPVEHNEDRCDLFHTVVAGTPRKTPPIYYGFSLPGTESPDRAGCWIELHYLPFRDTTGRVTHVGTITQDVTERVEAEREVALLKALVLNASDGITVSDATGTITFCNPAASAMIGQGRPLIGKTLADIHPDESATLAAISTQILTQGQWRGQLMTKHADSSSFLADVSSFLLRDPAGQPNGVAAIMRDLTEQQAQAQALLLFKTMAETALDGVAFASLAGTIEYANQAFRTMTGFGDGLVGTPIANLFAPEEMSYIRQTMLEDLAKSASWTGTLPARRPDGTTWMAQLSIVTLQDAQGNHTTFAGVCRDVTLQQAKERRLRQVEVMVDNAPDGFSYTDLEGRVMYMNPAFRAMLGYSAAPMGAPLLQFFVASEHEHIAQIIQTLLTQGGWQGTLGYQRADGSLLHGHLTAFVVRDNDGAPIALAGIGRDLTAQQHAEEERAALQEQVIAAQQAALRELSTPLIPITDGVVAMPLIGSIDSSRAQLVVDTLLTGTAELRAHTTIIDITGVPVVDTQVANALLRAAQAVKLLGAHVFLTGIRPEVAQTLVGLGIDLSGISTRSTLQSGIAEALARRTDASATLRARR